MKVIKKPIVKYIWKESTDDIFQALGHFIWDMVPESKAALEKELQEAIESGDFQRNTKFQMFKLTIEPVGVMK